MKTGKKLTLMWVLSSFMVTVPFAGWAVSAPGSNNTYSGFSYNMLLNSNVTPYRDTSQDLNALLEGNALVSQTTASNNKSAFQGYVVPYAPAISGATQISAANTTLQALAITMGLSGNYSAVTTQSATDYAVSAATTSNSALLWGTAASNQSSSTATPGLTLNNNVLTVAQGALGDFNVESILTPNNYSQSNVQKYLALVEGSAAPVQGMLTLNNFNNNTTNFNNYQLLVNREAAVQTAATDILQKIALSNAPMTGTTTASLGQDFVNTGMIPSVNNVERFMASRRLDPQTQWPYRVAQASSLELQRESLYLQAESLYELYQLHQTEQQNSLLLAMLLLEQTRSSIAMINQQSQITASQSTSSSSSTSTSTTSVTYS